MKNTLIILSLAIFSCSAFAQVDTELKNKKGIQILPKRGDFAIGADLLPYLNYFGNMFNETSDNTLDLGSQNLYFRYYITDKSAVRVNLMVGTSTNENNYYVADDAARNASPISTALVEDRETNVNNEFALLVGLQKSRGYGRLKGFYGLQVGYEYSKSKTNYEYGNNITQLNQTPTNHWNYGAQRPVENNFGAVNSIQGGGFVGVEYYILPKICLGGEYSLMYKKSWGTQSTLEYEEWGGENVSSVNRPSGPGDKSNNLGTIRPATYGGLYVMFHF